MAIVVTSEKFKNLDFPTSDVGTDYLMGYVGDKIQCTIDFYVKVSSENISVILSETSYRNTIRRTDSGSFLIDGFRIGDTITTTGTGADSGNFTIADVSDKIITVTGTFTTITTYFSAFVYRTTTIKASEYFYNLIENDAPDSFVSLVDNQTQQRYTSQPTVASGSTATYSIASNSKSWAVDLNGFGVTITGLGVVDYKHQFRITQTFLITPVALYSQITNLTDGIPPAPEYWQDRKCLRHVAKIIMKTEITSPEIVDVTTFSRKGNTGWFDEFLNGESPTYSLSSIAYSVGGVTKSSIDYLNSTTATINLTSANGTFTTGQTAVVHIIYLPKSDSDFVNVTTKYREVFAYDRALVTGGGGSAVGINLGTTYSQIQTASLTYNSTTSVTVTCAINCATALETRFGLKSLSDLNYFIFVTVQGTTVTSSTTTDRVAVKGDVNSYFTNKDDSTLFTITPAVSFTDAFGNNIGNAVRGRSGDIVKAVIPFTVKNTGTQLLESIGIRIQGQTTGATDAFTLEETTFDTSSYCLDDGIQMIDISQSKNYQLPVGSTLNEITVVRNSALDTATKRGYLFTYPFKLRYETWRTLSNADCDFGDATQDWSVITNKSGWQIKAIVTASVYDSTTDWTTDFEQNCEVTVSSSPTGSTNSWGTVTTYDSDHLYNQYGSVFSDQVTKVVANFYGNFTSLPTGTTGYNGVLYLDQKEIGGVTWTQSFSTQSDIRPTDGSSPWMPVTGSTGTATLIKLSNTNIQLTAYLDYKLLSPSIDNYNIRAKLDYIYT